MDLLGEKFLPQVIDEDLSVSGVSHVVLELAHAKRKASVQKFEDS